MLVLNRWHATPGNGPGRIDRNPLAGMLVETPIRCVRQFGVDHLLQITTKPREQR